MSILNIQRELCRAHGAEFAGVTLEDKLGITRLALQGVLPIHGLRHRPERGTSGWYVWSGDYSPDESFFMPLHVAHVLSEQVAFSKYLGLAPGWRFLMGEGGYEDVWFDADLISVV